MTAAPLAVADEQQASLARIARSTSLPHRTVVQAKALLLAADGVGTNEVARRCGTTNESGCAWCRRVEVEEVDGVGRIAGGRGQKSWLPPGTIAEVVRVTLQETPDDTSTHWTTRALANRLGIGKDTVGRICRTHRLKPWKVETFKLSNDPRFEDTLVDVHVVLDNLSAHVGPEVTRWLDHPKRARWHLHFTPTSSSWLNLVERWFKEITDRRLRRDVFTSIPDLVDAIETWTEHWNNDQKPFEWHKTAVEIVETVRPGGATLTEVKSATPH